MRKLLAVFLAAVMLVTSLSCLTLMTVSADSAATVTPYTADEFTAANAGNAIVNLAGDNLLTGNPEYKIFGWVNGQQGSIVSDAQPGNVSAAWLYNGGFATNGQTWYRNDWHKANTAHSADKSYITFNINSSNLQVIDKIFLAGTVTCTLADFELYLGNDKDTLYTDENLVATYSGPEGTDKYVYWVELAEGKKAKYLGMRVTTLRALHDHIAEGYDNGALELTGIGVYGSQLYSVDAYTKDEFTTANTGNAIANLSGDNLLTGNPEYKICGVVDGAYGSIVSDAQPGGISAAWLYNGEMQQVWQRTEWAKPYTSHTADKSYITFNISSGNFIAIDRIFLAGTVDSTLADFEIYLGNDKETLYNAENMVATYSGPEGTDKYVYWVELDESKEAEYLGIRVPTVRSVRDYASQYSTYALELTGVGVYGTPLYSVDAYTKDEFTTANAGNAIENLGRNNLLTGNPEYKICGVVDGAYGSIVSDAQPGGISAAWLYNGEMQQVWQRTEWAKPYTSHTADKSYITFNISSGNFIAIDRVFLAGTVNSTLADFEIYLGNDKETLYNAENMVATYSGPEGTDKYVYWVELAEAKEAEYLGVRVPTPRSVRDYASQYSTYALELTGIGVYGTSICTVSSNLYSSTTGNIGAVPNEQSLNFGMLPVYSYATVYGGAENTYIGEAMAPLTDGEYKPTANVVVSNGVNNSGDTFKLAYDLGAVKSVNSVTISSGSDDARHGIAKKWQVFVGNDLATLYDSANAYGIVDIPYDISNPPKGHINTITFPEDVQGRYVGVWFLQGVTQVAGVTDWSNNVIISEIAIHGTHIFDEPTDADLANLGDNLLDAEGLTTEATITNPELITDNVKKTTFNNKMVSVAAGSKLTYDIGMALDLEKLLVAAKTADNYKVYASNDLATLYDEALLTFNPKAISVYGIHTVDINAQYVGFEFTADATVIELGAYAKVDISALTGDKEIADIYVDGNKVEFVDANVYKNNSAIQVVYADGNNDVILVKGTALTKNEALANAFDFQGAQVRTNAPCGLRFVNTISANALALASKVGTLAAKFADLNGADLTNIDTTDYVIANAVVYDADTAIWMNGVEGTFSITINNIKDYLAATYYAARPYAVVTVDEVEYTIYGEEVKNTPVEIAKLALADENANLSEDAYLYLDTMVQDANVMNVATKSAAALGISDTMLNASVVNEDADYSRLAKVIEKAKSGQPIKLTALGGSVTHGANSGGNQAVTCYANRFREYLANTFGVEVTLVNAGISATNSDVGLARFDTNVPADTDLLVVDYAVNENPQGRTDTETVQTVDTSYEAIIRKALDNDMAVILLFNVYNNGGTATNDQIVKTKIGNHYKLPMVSVLNAVWDGTAYREEIDGNPHTVLSNDNIHPNAYGHKLLASLLSYTMANAIAFGDATAESYMPADYLYVDTAAKVNTVLYTTENLPEEWVVSMGDYYAEGSQYNEKLPNAWRIDNTGTQPMVLNIPNATYVTLIIYRPHLSNNNDVINAQAPIHTFTVNGTATQMYGAQTDSFAVALNNFCSTTATDCEVTLSTAFKDGGVETARIIGFAVAQAQ